MYNIIDIIKSASLMQELDNIKYKTIIFNKLLDDVGYKALFFQAVFLDFLVFII